MNDMLRVFGIAGSLRKSSCNRALLRAARELAPASLAIVIFDRLGEVPHYNAEVDAAGAPEPVQVLKEAIRSTPIPLKAFGAGSSPWCGQARARRVG